ncbi:uncharacterized protein BYT42DRAFT_576262 [Radiomyces spectabilis]|uniref:uncharacterized protein n=1 Tax=Radiomyces spectabilis TaxID=64574 RepID=UPI00221F595C|nr:uncharacterized protein BYT42DRAFT_576262 [Radiomyces spectabilis]KAI8374409.1 hypothetical protein BYT42DRAFT_576262 [Radiomyces spectabilis]
MTTNTEPDIDTLMREGDDAYASGHYETSVDRYSRASQLLDEKNGEGMLENAAAYFGYGRSLLQCAILNNTVLGDSGRAAESRVVPEPSVSSNPRIQFDDEAADVANDAQEEEGDEDEGSDDEEDDFETAWTMLDLARVALEKGEDKKSKLMLADVHMGLGDICLETEKFDAALTDYARAIELKQENLESDDRQLAEAHYKYALALEYSSDKSHLAVDEIKKATAVLRNRLEKLQQAASEESNGNEIKDIEALIPDMEAKMEELISLQKTEREAEALLKSMFASAGTDPEKVINTTNVNDLTSLVKKRKAPDAAASGSSGSASEAKKAKTEDGKDN